MENNSAKMARLLGRLKVEMNGAVTDSMRERGIAYPLNYGVSIPTVRAIASEYAPDHSLAKLLYRQQVRELKLSAIIVADPALVTPEELDFWQQGIENTEVAEHLAALTGDARISQEVAARIVSEWLTADSDLVKYTALLSLARLAANGTGNMPADLEAALAPAVMSAKRYVWQGLVALLSRLAMVSPDTKGAMRALLDKAEAEHTPSAHYLREEFEWQL